MALRKKTIYYEAETSEKVRETDTPVYDKKHWPGEWWRMELATSGLILDFTLPVEGEDGEERRDMKFTDLRVWHAIIEKLGEDNIAEVSQPEIARRLKTSRTAVNRSISTLVRLGLIEKLDVDTFRVDVETGWNGTSPARWEEKKAKVERSKLKVVE